MPNRARQIKTEAENKYPGSFLKLRVENGLIFQCLDGKEEHRYTTGPWHWRQKRADPWIEIDTDFEDSGDAVWKHHIKSAKFDTFLTDDGQKRFYPRRWITTEYVEFGALEIGTLATGWQTIVLGTLSRLNNRLVGEDKTTYRFETGFTGIGSRTKLVIKNPVVARPLRWKVGFVGLDWDKTKRAFISQNDSEVVGFIRPPYWTDSSVAPERHEVPWEYSGGYITLTPDFKGAIYPITIDPDYSIVAGADDGDVSVGFEAFHATATNAFFGNSAGSPDNNLWFRFAAIVAAKGGNCTAATIKIITSGQDNGTDMQMIIHGIDEDDHTAPTDWATWATDHGIPTSAAIHWDFATLYGPGDSIITSDFSDVIDELIARDGWSTGQAIGIHIDDDGCAAYAYRNCSFYENETYGAPVLSLTIEEAPPVGVPVHFMYYQRLRRA